MFVCQCTCIHIMNINYCIIIIYPQEWMMNKICILLNNKVFTNNYLSLVFLVECSIIVNFKKYL